MRTDVACGYEVLPVMHEPLVGLNLHQEQVPLSLATLITRGYSSIKSRYIILDANRRTINEEDDVLLYATRRQEEALRIVYEAGRGMIEGDTVALQKGSVSVTSKHSYIIKDKTILRDRCQRNGCTN